MRTARLSLIVVLLLTLTACNESAVKRKPDAQALTTSTASAQLVQGIGNDDAAVMYYTSGSRRAMLQAFLDTSGKELANRLLGQDIPSTVDSWEKKVAATADGYNTIHSISKDPYYEVTVKYAQGAPDLTQGIFGLSVHRDGVMYSLVGGTVITAQNQTLTDVQSSWCWWSSNGGINIGPSVSESQGRQADHEPIYPNRKYYVILSGGHATTPQLRKADAVFIAALQKVIGSD